MTLKRKRSSPTFSSPGSEASDSTIASSSPLPFFFAQSKPVQPLPSKAAKSFVPYDEWSESPHLNIRTRKRYRDNRPDDETVHGTRTQASDANISVADVPCPIANTIDKLFQAQRQHPNASPVLSREMPQQTRQQRSTLHSFWRIEQPPTSAPMQDVTAQPMLLDTNDFAVSPKPLCEDCDRPLQHPEAMDINDASDESDARCQLCQRHVCDTCAVLGDARICLACSNYAH